MLGPRDSFTFEKLVINDTLKKQTTHSSVNNVEWNEAFEFLTFPKLSIKPIYPCFDQTFKSELMGS